MRTYDPALIISTALRRAHGASVYLDARRPGIAQRVADVRSCGLADEPWTATRWMMLGSLSRAAVHGLEGGLGDEYADHAILVLRTQLAYAVRAAQTAVLDAAGDDATRDRAA